jgi:hypothetical protein
LHLFKTGTQACRGLNRGISLIPHLSHIGFGGLSLSIAVDNRINLVFASHDEYASRKCHRFSSTTMNE